MAKKSDVSEEKQKALQEKYMEFQVLGARVKKIREQLEVMDQQCVEMNSVIESLAEFGRVKNGSEVLVPVSNGIFARAELKDNDALIVNVGSDVCVGKTVVETEEILASRLQEMVDEREQVFSQLQRFGLMAQELERDLTKLASEA